MSRIYPWPSMPLLRMGPPLRSSLPMRITASWFGSSGPRIQGCGTNIRAPHAGSSSASSSRPQQVCRRARSRQGPSPSGGRHRRSSLDRSCARRRQPGCGGSGRRNGFKVLAHREEHSPCKREAGRNGRRSRLRSGRPRGVEVQVLSGVPAHCSLRQAAKASVPHTDIPRFESWSEHQPLR